MVAWPNHVPAEDHTASNTEHVELHDTTTDAVASVQAQVTALNLAGLPDVDIPIGIQPGWVAVRSGDGRLTFADPATLPAPSLLCE